MVRKVMYSVAMLATMVGVALPAPADAKPSLRARVHKLEKAQKSTNARLAQDEDALGLALGLLSCFAVQGVDDAMFVPPGAVDPVQALVYSPLDTPLQWVAVVDPSCVDTGAGASARARTFRGYFGRVR